MIQHGEPKKGRPIIHPQSSMWTITVMMTPEQTEVMKQITRNEGSKAAAVRFLINKWIGIKGGK